VTIAIDAYSLATVINLQTVFSNTRSPFFSPGGILIWFCLTPCSRRTVDGRIVSSQSKRITFPHTNRKPRFRTSSYQQEDEKARCSAQAREKPQTRNKPSGTVSRTIRTWHPRDKHWSHCGESTGNSLVLSSNRLFVLTGWPCFSSEER